MQGGWSQAMQANTLDQQATQGTRWSDTPRVLLVPLAQYRQALSGLPITLCLRTERARRPTRADTPCPSHTSTLRLRHTIISLRRLASFPLGSKLLDLLQILPCRVRDDLHAATRADTVLTRQTGPVRNRDPLRQVVDRARIPLVVTSRLEQRLSTSRPRIHQEKPDLLNWSF